MIDESNFSKVLELLEFVKNGNRYTKQYVDYSCEMIVDFDQKKMIYPDKIEGWERISKFGKNEFFVQFECVDRLLTKGYRPEHIEIEKSWRLGHDPSGGRGDVCVYNEDRSEMLFIIECKTAGKEYKKAYNDTLADGGQIFPYWQQEGATKWLALYTSELVDNKIDYKCPVISCTDDPNFVMQAKKDASVHLYANTNTATEKYDVWQETYGGKFNENNLIFSDDTVAYKIGIKPLVKGKLVDFSADDKIVNQFEEILRHNSVSDKENAFNRLIALFICKLVDEIQKSDNDVVEFQYKVGTDTYESLQDRLQKLHKEGMEKFMKEDIFYVSDDYAEKLVQQYTGQKRTKMIEELKSTLRVLKFYTNNDFAFKDVHNEELFYQNGKILVEVVQLFQKYRIIGSNNLQLLGDLFEQLLNKGFKQNEGQFFTPIPITHFIWDSIPLEKIVKHDDKTELPKVIDYACGAGHFLTEGYEAISEYLGRENLEKSWEKEYLYGIEKDYRLARVSKISLFMHGAGDGNIIFGDGLDNYPEKGVENNQFDILVANPPYSVAAFKPHLNLKNNSFLLFDSISNAGKEIETLFTERIAQLVSPNGIAAVILPTSILDKDYVSFIGAREVILTNFNLRAIVQMENKTFGATGQNTVILFMEKYSEPPKRSDLVADSVEAIFSCCDLADWEDNVIFAEYLGKIGVSSFEYMQIITRKLDYTDWKDHVYFGAYVSKFSGLSNIKNKKSQKTFKALDVQKQMEWLNKEFYDFVIVKEKEKVAVFSFVYNQRTLVVHAPKAVKKQEKFLGYKWNNRKGSEGIQTLNLGGMLFNPHKRYSTGYLSEIIRASFDGNVIENKELEPYYTYLDLHNMIDFSGVAFTKKIKTTGVRIKKAKTGTTVYYLSNSLFDLQLGDRVVADEQLVEGGKIPVYSANVYEPFGFIDSEILEDYSRDSIIWGIDGDWMVTTIDKNIPFYPTDHCGVLRTDEKRVNPKYLAMALEVEGKLEKFSRNNRASIQRIKSLSVRLPDEKSEQDKFVEEIEKIDCKIDKMHREVKAIDDTINDYFMSIFGDVIGAGNTITIKEAIDKGIIEKPLDGNHGEKHPKATDFVSEGIPFIMANNLINGEVDLKNCAFITKKQAESLDKGFAKSGDVLLTHKGTIGRTAILEFDGEYVVLTPQVTYYRSVSSVKKEFIKAYFDTDYFQSVIKQMASTGSTRDYVGITAQQDLPFFIPDEKLQDKFVEFFNQKLSEKKNKISEINKLEKKRIEMIEKRFIE